MRGYKHLAAAARSWCGTIAGMAHAPVVLAAYTALRAAVAEHSTFDTATQEAIALAVAAADGCDYCQAAHTGAARKAGLTLELTVAIRAGRPTDPKLDALLAVAPQAVTQLGEVDETTWHAALDAGWSLEELAELSAHLVPNMSADGLRRAPRRWSRRRCSTRQPARSRPLGIFRVERCRCPTGGCSSPTVKPGRTRASQVWSSSIRPRAC